MTKYWDINVFFRDLGNDEHGVNQWSDTITLNPAIYVLESDTGSAYDAVYKAYTGILYECNIMETVAIRELRSEMEYGMDWWDFIDHLYELNISSSINNWLDDLPDPYSIDIESQDSLYNVKTISDLHNLVG
jgi:hypothetical protein